MSKKYINGRTSVLCVCLLAASIVFAMPTRATGDEVDPSPIGAVTVPGCPTSNNACNQNDGCDSSLQDLGFWTHWIGMRRGDTNPSWLPCKDRYAAVTSGGGCTKGAFARSFNEFGCP